MIAASVSPSVGRIVERSHTDGRGPSSGATKHLVQATLGASRAGGFRYSGATHHLVQATLGASRAGGPRYN
jgi:hypothetical protein